MSDAFGNKNQIKCACAGKHPKNGHSLVQCRECEQWLHMNCMLARAHKFTARDSTHGFKCPECRTETRREAAKAGYRARADASLASLQDTPTTSGRAVGGREATANASTGQRLRADSTILASTEKAGPLQSRAEAIAEEKAFYASLTKGSGVDTTRSVITGHPAAKSSGTFPTPSTQTPKSQPLKTKALRAATARPSPLPADLPTSDVGDDSPALQCDKPASSVFAGPASKPAALPIIRKRKAATQDPPEDDPVVRWMSTAELPDVVCSCKSGPGGRYREYIICARCPKLMHKVCMPSAAVDTIGEGKLCAECRAPRVAKACRNQLKENFKARLERRAMQQKADAERGARDEKLKAVVTDHFWKGYCDLPEGKASPAVLELTSRYYSNGGMVPIHPAPASWIDEVLARLHELISPANRQLVKRVVGRNPSALSISQPDLLRRGLGEVAVLKIHHGSPKGTKKNLGVLAEVLGLEEKGTYWHG